MNIPTWFDANKRVSTGIGTPLDIFIFNHEPAGSSDEKKFREELVEMLEYIVSIKEIKTTDRNPAGCTCYLNNTLIYERCPIHGGK